MSFTDAPPTVDQFKTQVLACASFTWGSGAIHYPECNFESDSTPLVVLDESSQESIQWAYGAGGLRSGTLRATFHSDSHTVGQMETLARSIGTELMAQYTGFLFRSFNVGLSSQPKPQMDKQIVSIDLTVQYGVNPQ